MRRIIYVLSHGHQWKVKCDHCDSEIKDTKTEAIRLAKKHVGSLPAGTLSQILIQKNDGSWQTEWTYGADPFPPRG